ncbi:MAG: PepSY domain-containing protein [Ilumatobacteraceae bacterium]
MASLKAIKRWFWWHRWTSLVCTIFLLVICLTGLPLIFAEEIENWVNPRHYPDVPATAQKADLDAMVSKARSLYPQDVVCFIYVDPEEPQVLITMAPTRKPDDKKRHGLQFDSRTGNLLKDEPPFEQQPTSFMEVMFSLHTDLFAGISGELFLGLMGLLFVISTVSGIVLYGPFMKKLDFGTVRFWPLKAIEMAGLAQSAGHRYGGMAAGRRGNRVYERAGETAFRHLADDGCEDVAG